MIRSCYRHHAVFASISATGGQGKVHGIVKNDTGLVSKVYRKHGDSMDPLLVAGLSAIITIDILK
jgi:hypothetical protein